MKNIYVLTALIPSRLSDCHNNKLYLDDTRYLKNYKELFITSDEEIKKEDWVLLGDIMKLYKVEYTSQCPDYNDDTDIKKIILTTDSQLIKDGVQTINDEFLEWWIKNPSCEFVETKLIEQRSHLSLNDWVNTDKDGKFPISIAGAFCYRKIYKIIIPKEEHKGRVLSKEEVMSNRSNTYEFIDFDKQETLEEAAEKFRIENPGTMQGGNNTKIINAFKEGAKWQAKKTYTEVEVLEILTKFWMWSTLHTTSKHLKNWFNNIKKK